MGQGDKIAAVQPLPSGLVVDVGWWATKDILAAGQASAQRLLRLMDGLLSRATVVSDPRGVYDFAPGAAVDPLKLLSGDRSVLAIYQRMASIPEGHILVFDFASADPLARGKTSSWRIDLRRLLLPYVPPDPNTPDEDALASHGMRLATVRRGDVERMAVVCERLGTDPIELGDDRLYYRPLTDEAAEAFTHGNRCEFVTQTGVRLWWKQFTGADLHAPFSRLKAKDHDDQSRVIFEYLVERIVEVEGVEKKALRAWLGDLCWGDTDALMAAISERECGVETSLEVVCNHSGRSQMVEVPLMSPHFFSPRSERTASGKR